MGVLNFQDKKELIRLVRIKNSRRFRKKEKQMKQTVKHDRNQEMQQDIQIQYLKKQVLTLSSNLDELMDRESLNLRRETMQTERMQEIDLRI